VSYTVGTKVHVETELRDADGDLTNATVVIAVTKPDGTVVTPAPTVSNPSTGVYTADITTDQAGTWLLVWTASGALVAVKDDQFSVVAARLLVASLQEFKQQLNRTGSDDDEELRTYLEAATDFVEDPAIGGPVSAQTFTERTVAKDGVLVLSRRPLISVTSVTPVTNGVLGTALASTQYRVDDVGEVVELFSYGSSEHEVVYRAGMTSIAAGVKIAGLIIAQHLWQTQNNNSGGRPPVGDDATVFLPGASFAIPHRAAELLKSASLSGVA